MRNNKFTSAADRRWQRRYEAIVQRKEDNWEYDQSRKQKKAERKLTYKRDVELDFSKLDGLYLPAVLCTTNEKAQHLLREVWRLGISTSLIPEEMMGDRDDRVYAFLGGYPNWSSVIQVSMHIAKRAECHFVPYEELLPPPDYGEICNVSELSMLFV